MAKLLTDVYERKARLYPALLLIAPAVVTAFAMLSAKWSLLRSIGAVIVGCGGAFLLAQLARDFGKRREKQLFEKWGGVPSVTIFRHRDGRLDAITKERYHKRLTTLVKGAKAPTATQEEDDPSGADEVYAAWSNYLRTNTRDTKKYGLLFQENISYGYRRNVWGLRPIGIPICVVCCVVATAYMFQIHRAGGQVSEEVAAAFIFVLILLILWLFRFSADWVRIPADAYAERLAETVEIVGR